ncbi:hypothetical protein MC378_10485 [Polaribacter sp. MSW13]|uniref:Uncharacterized protein n=1 Tax=Polaribacter marinus TaxID=2916838 RepID=A0A9X1VNY7_9FLAO|nr:hypothetical protein [Polaribacter marinus]MCI2229595.1 hypothetical protein [Polaribacter marinus]
MTYILILMFLGIIYYLYKTSSSKFFLQSEKELVKGRSKLFNTYHNYGRSNNAINEVLEAYDYFCKHPKEYDGSTIVRDLFDIKHNGLVLSGSSLRHDYEYIFGANTNWIKNYKANVKYYNSLLSNGKPTMVGWLIGLHVLGAFYVPIMFFKMKLNELYTRLY